MADDENTERTMGIVLRKGSKYKLRPFVERAEAARVKGANGGYRLAQELLERQEVLATWDADDVDSRREVWFDEVMEMVAEATETEGVKSNFWVIAWEGSGPSERIINKYKITAQPGSANVSPTAEGLVHQAMTQTNRAFTHLLNERAAATSSMTGALDWYRKENERLQKTVERYQQREEDMQTRMWSLLDRERELIRAEAQSESKLSEASEERLERITEKVSEAVATIGAKMGETAVSQMSGEQIMKFIGENKDLVKLFFPNAEGTN